MYTNTTHYTGDFFDQIRDGSIRSAREVVPFVMKLVAPKSIVDIGCGIGTWLKAFAEAGVTEYEGYDGDYVNRSTLLIDQSRFHPVDLCKLNSVGRKYDLALCLEVGEHLPESRSKQLVALLTNTAPVIVFSAALPGQGGTNHINEQWPRFWQSQFLCHNYLRIDAIRPAIWRNPNIEWWYKQNIFMYVHKKFLEQDTILMSEYLASRDYPFELLHDRIILRCEYQSSLSGLIRQLPSAFINAVKRRFRRYFSSP